MTSKNYSNSDREKLIFPEYGRHIQKMARGLMKISDRDERTRQAHIVVDVMGNLNNVLRDTKDFKHKLWDHLFILSDFKLDVDFPYEIPDVDELNYKPSKIDYPKRLIGYKQYGRNIRKIIDTIVASDDQDKKIETAADVVKFMKLKSYEFNQDFPSDEVIINDFQIFSRGKIDIDEEVLAGTKIVTKKKVMQKRDNGKQHRNTLSNNHSQQRGRVKTMSAPQHKKFQRAKEV
ncbi:MAG: DUF4290 domain-containing protein [Rikenellaceae bacterium]